MEPPVLLEDARYDKTKTKITAWSRLRVRHIPAKHSEIRDPSSATLRQDATGMCRHWSSRLQRYCGEQTAGIYVCGTDRDEKACAMLLLHRS